MGMIMGMAAGVGLVFCFARWEISRSKERMKLVSFFLNVVKKIPSLPPLPTINWFINSG